MENQAQNISLPDAIPATNGWFQIAVSNDTLVASVKKIVRHVGNGKPVKTNDIFKKRKQLKVSYGIDSEAIKNLIKLVDDNNITEEPVVIAKGDVENGKNGTIEWCIEGITEENSEFLVVPNIKIAVMTLASQGKKGKNVFGKSKNPRPGFDQQLNNGDGVVYSQVSDGVLIYESARTGMLRYKSGTLTVDSGLEISEDKLQVHMNIYAGKIVGIEKDITRTDVLNMLEQVGVKYGINTELIMLTLEQARLSAGVVKNVLVAEGKAPVNGDDEVIEWSLDVQSEDINKRAVLPGQMIATIKSNVESISGLDVFNNPVPGINGTKTSLECGQGVEKRKVIGGYEYISNWLGVVQIDSDTLTVKSGIKISDDKMKATMSLLRPDIASDKGNISLAHVLKTLHDNDVVYGIKNDDIKLILEDVNREEQSKVDVLVADGLPAKDGVDARIDYDKELSVGGKILPNGKIDYREKSYPWNVKVNDIIGKIIPPQRSEDGKNITGEILIANPVKESKPKLEGIKKDVDGTLRVTEDGILLTNGINLKVSDSLELEGDVCQKTGNINSDKPVIVKGYVEPGFVLETKGDAIIQENVEDAIVNADGNVVIKSGIRGTHSKIISGADLTAAFAENAELNASGDIIIANSVINCHTVSQGMVRIGDANSGKSALVGDVTQALKGVEVAILGSDSFNKTIIEAGTGGASFIKLKELTDEILNIKKGIADLNRLYEHCCKNPKPQREQNALLLKLTATQDQKKKIYEDLLEEKEKLNILIESSKNVKVIVHRRVYPGVVIHILNKTYEVNEERNSGVFILKGEQIIFEPA